MMEPSWGTSAQGSQSHSTGLSLGRTTALKHLWVLAARSYWRGTPLATPNTGSREATWSSWSRRRPPSTLPRRAETTGALVFGRRTFDLTHGWGGKHPLDVPVFVVTRSVPQDWVYEGSPFTFVTDGLESALDQAKAVAGDK